MLMMKRLKSPKNAGSLYSSPREQRIEEAIIQGSSINISIIG
jgi:hypothetical protein